MNVSYRQKYFYGEGNTFGVSSPFFVGNNYISSDLVTDFVNFRGIGVGMFRVYTAIKALKQFSGNIDIANKNKIKILAEAINMPYRSIKQNIKRLVDGGYIVQDNIGHWKIISAKQCAEKTLGGTGRIKINLKSLFTQKAASRFLRAASFSFVAVAYKDIRSVTPNSLFIPKQIRTNSIFEVLKYGQVMPWQKDGQTRVVNRANGVKDYVPMSANYASKFIARSSETLRGWRNTYDTSEGYFKRVQWVVTFNDKFSRDKVVSYLKYMNFAGKVYTGLAKKSSLENGKWRYKDHYYLSFDIASHFCTGGVVTKKANLNDRALTNLIKRRKAKDQTISRVKNHCTFSGISYSSFNYTLKQSRKGIKANENHLALLEPNAS